MRRCAVGFGWTDETNLDIAAHELAHTLGRMHAPCSNVGQGPGGVDPAYPHDKAGIGGFGYDVIKRQLKDPARYKDFMSYCSPYWVSDYTYAGLFERISYVNRTP
jgi:hypothetical protein